MGLLAVNCAQKARNLEGEKKAMINYRELKEGQVESLCGTVFCKAVIALIITAPLYGLVYWFHGCILCVTAVNHWLYWGIPFVAFVIAMFLPVTAYTNSTATTET